MTFGNGSFPTSALGDVTSSIGKLVDEVDMLQSSIQAQLDQLTAACTVVASLLSRSRLQSQQQHSRSPRSHSSGAQLVQPGVDRSLNIVVSGIKESRDSAGWKALLANVLHIAADQDVDVVDAFRIGGRYLGGTTGPYLVKLHSAWTR